jgi:hypothetical protein
MSIIALIATVPARRRSCERLLAELAKQTRPPDSVALVLDGYGNAPAPACSLPIVAESRTAELSGAGNRWRVLHEWASAGTIAADDIIACIDDDTILFEAPQLIAKLVEAVEASGAAAPMGRTFDGKAAPPGAWSRGDLMHAAGCGVTARAGVLAGVVAFANDTKTAGGPDALGPGGDDDAIVSAYLWKSGLAIKHAAVGGPVYTAPGIVSTFKRQNDPDAQKRAIAKVTGWPWKVYSLMNPGAPLGR